MNPTRHDRGSVSGVVLAVVVLALVGLAVWWGVQERTRLRGQVTALQSEVSDARARVDELQKKLDTESAARKKAEATASAAGDAAEQARQELQSQQEKLGSKVQELQANLQQDEQKIAAADEARKKAETELAHEVERRKAAEQQVAAVNDQLQQQKAVVGQLQRPSESPTGQNSSGGGRPASTGAETEASPPPTSASSAAKQSFAGEPPADEGASYDTPPKALDLVSPEYPHSLRQQGIEGEVEVAFTVDAHGRVQDIEVQDATNEAFSRAAVAAVRQWRFKPALRDGKPVEVRTTQRLNFTSK